MKRDRIESLKPVLVLVIALLAGPEFFLGMELLTLLDLLGVGLFLLAHGYALRLALAQFLGWTGKWAVPVQLLAKPTFADIRQEPRLLSLIAPIALFYLSYGALGLLFFMIASDLYLIPA